MIKKEGVKILKRKELIIEIQRRWIPVITGATGTISVSLSTYLTFEEIMKLRNHKKKKKSTFILGTEEILREMLMKKYKTYFVGEITLHVAKIVNTEQLQHCIP